MKSFAVATALALAMAPALAQSADMKDMDMKGTDRGALSRSDKSQKTHRAVGVVKKIDLQAGRVSLAHEPVKSLNWPAMTMAFQVEDKAMLDKLAEGRKVEVAFEQRGKAYVITSIK